MLDILNVFFLATTIASQALAVVANAQNDIKMQENIKVYRIDMKQQAPMWVDKCLYNGVAVEYTRDWEEIQKSTGTVLPPEPDKPIGYAVILTKEKCPGKEGRNIFTTGSKPYKALFNRDYVILEGYRIDTVDYINQKEDFRPKWMPQVLKTIEKESSSNPAAAEFISEMKLRAEANKDGKSATP